MFGSLKCYLHSHVFCRLRYLHQICSYSEPANPNAACASDYVTRRSTTLKGVSCASECHSWEQGLPDTPLGLDVSHFLSKQSKSNNYTGRGGLKVVFTKFNLMIFLTTPSKHLDLMELVFWYFMSI